MSTTAVPPKKTNRIGLEVLHYKGSKTTLCAGCGHNAVSERIVEVFYEMGVQPWKVAKFSGIGCSSKSPAYFLNLAHGFNSVHGRAASVATGAMLANRDLLGVVVTGDGDTASIGIGQFVHMLRRNLPLVYIIEDNGVYGLTKGQFSATSDYGAKSKGGSLNEMHKLDCCLLGIELGATLVARTFSGDKKQLQAILKPPSPTRD
jgi:2-oxoglutarate/2-oxoacid ferredoxin oxidoreductase subunit beta